ncbi:type VI secretion system-associated protein TagO [Enterovibrio sp. ZSDZ35]|uniref:Type VI secretion system-associated protein TagO n=1 Tax=Enterovibrio qingdaonensis TaxID=2899818 RepID=A0ABT5QJP7_9GAMM|nr:type VI secretion system-associated protein VasI [Enterovibrio sp. ZSDZ35]MDD1780511.1 type VI secretion system-associated protein TagO [Enterovibrio sp. ZSDZ35]
MHRFRSNAMWKLAGVLALFQTSPALSNAVADNQVSAAETCTLIPSRLERLACFDKVFDTPVSHELALSTAPRKPALWVKAAESEKRRQPLQTGFIVNVSDEMESMPGAWVTSPAVVETDQAPAILMFGCIDDISRVELVLPNMVNSGRVPITTYAKNKDTRAWMSDDSGYVLSAGRGMPAIVLMKSMLSQSSVSLRSNSAIVGDVRFDISNINEAVKPLRKMCGW